MGAFPPGYTPGRVIEDAKNDSQLDFLRRYRPQKKRIFQYWILLIGEIDTAMPGTGIGIAIGYFECLAWFARLAWDLCVFIMKFVLMSIV